MHHHTEDGRAFRTLNILDPCLGRRCKASPRREFTRDCLAIRVRRKLSSIEVIDALTDLFIPGSSPGQALRGIPAYIRSDNGPEFVAEAVRTWIAAVGSNTAYIGRRIRRRITLGKRLCRKLQRIRHCRSDQWRNNGSFRDEPLKGEIFHTLREAQILIEDWRVHYNTRRPHSALGYQPPAPEAIVNIDQRPTMN